MRRKKKKKYVCSFCELTFFFRVTPALRAPSESRESERKKEKLYETLKRAHPRADSLFMFFLSDER